MKRTALHRLGKSFIVAATLALVAACADRGPVGPDRAVASLEDSRIIDDLDATRPNARDANPVAGVEGCEKLQVPAGSKLVFHAYATGVQIYGWNGTNWGAVGPSAVLSADAKGNSTVGTHYAGPTWESISGSKVVGAVLERCTPDPDAIPWLLLGAVSTEGPGIFHRVAFIQRVNTVGGNPPSTPGAFTGAEARVPYSTEYLFYTAP